MSPSRELRDLYDVLGVSRDADAREIQKAYRDRARSLHPDVSGDPDAEAHFRELSHAYEVLSKQRSRILYDRLAYRGPGGGGFGPAHRGVARPTKRNRHVSDGELLSWVFGGEPQPVVVGDLRPEDDPIVLALAFAAFVASIVTLIALLIVL
jgi:curved DNA-binding protein CbpA